MTPTKRYCVSALDKNTGKVVQLFLNEEQYQKMLAHYEASKPEEFKYEPPVVPAAKPIPFKYVCADCGNEGHLQRGPCPKCFSMRIILISFAEEHFGKDWRETCFGSEKE